MAEQRYDFTESELTWFKARVNQLNVQFSQDSDDPAYAYEAAKQQAWSEFSELKDGRASEERQQKFKDDTTSYRMDRFQDAISASLGIQTNTTLDKLSSPGLGELPESLLDSTDGDIRRGWQSPIEQLSWLASKDQDAQGGIFPRSAGLPYSMGLESFTGLIKPNTFEFDNPVTETVANFAWGLWKGGTLGAGPAVQRLIERHTGANVYPDWADKPALTAGRVAQTLGDVASWLIPWTGSAKAFKGGAKLAQIGIKAGIEKAGFKTVEGVVAEAAPRIARGMTEGFAKEAGVLGQKAVSEISQEMVKSAVNARRLWVGGNAREVWAVMKDKSVGGIAKKVETHLQSIGHAGVDDIVARHGLSPEMAKYLKGEMIKVVGISQKNRLADFAGNKISYMALSMAEHGLVSGMSMALQSSALVASEMIGDEVPIRYAPGAIAKTVAGSMTTGLMFGAFGAIPNVGKAGSRSSVELMTRALGFSSAASRAVSKSVMESGVKGRLKSMFYRGVNLDKELAEKGAGAIRLRASGLKEVLKGLGMDDVLKNYKVFNEGGWNTPERVKSLIGELNSFTQFAQHNQLRMAATEMVRRSAGAMPRMIFAGLGMNVKGIFLDHEAAERNPEDLVMGIAMAMYFTRNHVNPLQNIGNPLDMPKSYINEKIETNQMLLHMAGDLYPELAFNPKISHLMERYRLQGRQPFAVGKSEVLKGYQDIIERAGDQPPTVEESRRRPEKPVKVKEQTFASKEDFELFNARKELETIETEKKSEEQKVIDIERYEGRLAEKVQPSTAISSKEFFEKKKRIYDLESRVIDLEEKGFTGKIIDSPVPVTGDAMQEPIQDITTPSDVIAKWIAGGGERRVRNTIQALNDSRGLTGLAEKPLVDDSKFSHEKLYNIEKDLLEHMGGRELDPYKITEEVDKAVENDTRKIHAAMNEMTRNVANDLEMGQYPQMVRLEKVDPNNTEHMKILEMQQIYNSSVQIGFLTGGLKAREWMDRATPLKIKEWKDAGEWTPTEGAPKPNERLYKPSEYGALSLALEKHVEVLKDVFGEIVGKEYRDLIADPLTLNHFVNGVIAGQGRAIERWFEGTPVIFPVSIPMGGTIENQDRKITFDIKDSISEMHAAGLLSGRMYQKIAFLAKNYTDMDPADRPELGGMKSAEGIERYRTNEGRWEVLTSFLELFPFHSSYVMETNEANMKLKFSRPEAEALKRLTTYIIEGGLGFGRAHTVRLKSEAIGKRYARATPVQMAVLEAADELKCWNFDTGKFTFPDVIEFVDAKGNVVKEYDNLDGLYARVKEQFRESKDAGKLIDTVNDLMKLGIVKSAEFNPDGIKAGDSYSLAPGSYLNGQEAMDYLTSAFRVSEGGINPKWVIEQLQKQVRLAAIGDPSKTELAEIITKDVAKLFLGNKGISFGKAIHFLELHGLIKGVDKEGNYNFDNVKKIFEAKTRDALRNFEIAHSEYTADQLAEQYKNERHELREQYEKVIDRNTNEKEWREVKINQFLDRTKITEDQHEFILGKMHDGRIKSGEDLRTHVLSILTPGEKPIQYADALNRGGWQAAYKQLKNTRIINRITFDRGAQYVLSGGQPELVSAPGIRSERTKISGSHMIDQLRAIGLDLAVIDAKYYTGEITKKSKNDLAFEEHKILDRIPDETYALLQDILNNSNVRKDLAQKAVFRTEKDGKQQEYLGELGVIVPVGIGEHGRYLAIELPVASSQPDSPYVRFRDSLLKLDARFDMLHGIRETEAQTGIVDWHKETNELDVLRTALKKVLEKMPDPTLKGGLTIDGKSLAEWGIPSGQLSRAMHALTFSNRFGESIFDIYQNALRSKIGGDAKAHEEFMGEIYKRSKLFTNISSEGLDQSSWEIIKEEHNADQNLRGPQLGSKLRFAIVDDAILEEGPFKGQLDEKKKLYGAKWALDGMIIMSERFASAACETYGAKEGSPLLKAFFTSTNSNLLGQSDMMSALTKASYQAIEFYQPMLEKLGVDFIVPASALKFASPEVKANMMKMEEVLRDLPEATKTYASNVIEMPVEGFNLMSIMPNGPKPGTVSTSMEYSLSGQALNYFYEKFGDVNSMGEGGGLKLFDDFYSLLMDARMGSRGRILELNDVMRHFYSMAEDTEGYVVEPDFPSAHKAFIFSSPLANPMDPAWRGRTTDFIRTRILSNNVLRAHSAHARQAVMQAPFLSDGLRSDHALPGPGDVNSFGIGQALGSAYDQSTPLHANTQLAYFDKAAGEWKHAKINPESIEAMFTTFGKSLKVSKEFMEHLKGQGVDLKDPKAVAGFIHREMIGIGSGENLHRTNPGTEGRFFEVMDHIFAGSVRGSSGEQRIQPSYTYGGADLRQGHQFGLLSTFQRTPKILGNDMIVAVKKGFLPEMHGNAVMLNRSDASLRSKADWDWDKINYTNDVDPVLIDELIKRAGITTDVTPDESNRVPTEFEISSLKDWTRFRGNRAAADLKLGGSQQMNQAYGAFVAGQRYVKLQDPVTHEPYFLGPRYRSYDDMVAAGVHTLLQKEITTFTDAAGKLIDVDHMGDNWKVNVFRKLFARYDVDAAGTAPDFSKFHEIVPGEKHLIDLSEAMIGEYKRLSSIVSSDKPQEDGSTGSKIEPLFSFVKQYTRMMLGPEMNPNNPSQNQLINSMMSSLSYKGTTDSKIALKHIWAALGIDPVLVGKLAEGKPLDKYEKLEKVWAQINAAANVGPNLYYQGTQGYQSVRERLAMNIAKVATKYDGDKYRGLDREANDNLGQLSDAIMIAGGLPDQWTLRRLSGYFYRYYKTQGVTHVKEMEEKRERYKEQLETGDFKKGQDRLLKGQIAGISLFLKEKSRYLSAREKRDEKEKFTVNTFGGKGMGKRTQTVSDQDFTESFTDRMTAWMMSSKYYSDNPELFKVVQEDAAEVRGLHGTMFHQGYTYGVGDAIFSRRAGISGRVHTQLTTDVLNKATASLVDEYMQKWAGNEKLAALLLYCDSVEKVTGFFELNQSTGAKTKVATEKNFIPDYRKPFTAALMKLDPQAMAEWALTKSIIRNAIHDGDKNTMLQMIKGQLEGFAGMVSTNKDAWMPKLRHPLYSALELVTRKRMRFEGKDLIDVDTGTTVPLQAWNGPMVVKVGDNLIPMSYREFATMLVKSPIAQSFTVPTDMQVWAKQQAEAVMDAGGVLDVTKLDPSNPIKRIASFVLSERARTLPEHFWDDIKLMSRYLKTTTGQSTNPFGRQVEASLKLDNRMPGSGGLAARKGRGDLWKTDPMELQKDDNEVKRALGRLWADIAKDNSVGEHRGEPIDFMEWSVAVLGKDIRVDKIKIEDVLELKMEWRRELDRIRMANAKGYTGAMWGVKRKFLATKEILSPHFLTSQVGKAHERASLDKQHKMNIASNKAMKVVGKFQKLLYSVGIDSNFQKWSKKLSEKELGIDRVNRQIENMESSLGLGAAHTSPYYQQFTALRSRLIRERDQMQVDPQGMTAENRVFNVVATAMDLGNCIKSVDQVGVIEWRSELIKTRDEILGTDKVTGSFENFKQEITDVARDIHTLFRDIRPDIVDGMEAWKKLQFIRMVDQGGVPEDLARKTIDGVSLGYQQGYIPQYNYDHFNDLAQISDRGFKEPGSIMGNLENVVAPRGIGEMMHRTGGLDWSKNIALTMNRYIQDVYMFKYKNMMELALHTSISGLTELQAKQSPQFIPQSQALISYLEKWRSDNITVTPREDFYSVAANYIRGVQLISKLGWQISTPIRNLSQVVAQTFISGWSNVKESKSDYDSNAGGFRDFVGDLSVEGSMGDMELNSTQGDVRSLMYGQVLSHEQALRKKFRTVVSSSLYPLQKMPFLGERDVRKVARITAFHEVWKKFYRNGEYQNMFETRDFSEEFLKAFPEIERFTKMDAMGNKIGEKEWASGAWKDQFTGWCRRMAENAASDLQADVHFEYSMGSRPEAFRTPLGSILFQLKYFTVKNAAMWTKLVKEAKFRGEISDGWAEKMHSKEFSTMFGLGLFGMILTAAPYVAPLGLSWMFRPDWMDILKQTNNGLRLLSSDDQDKINKAFYGKGALQYAFGPALGDASMMINLAFAQHIGEPSNAGKLLIGMRDMRQLDQGEMFFKMARVFGPAVIADVLRYDFPELVRNNMRTWPQFVAGVAGFNYRKDEGEKAKQLTDWFEGKYNERYGSTGGTKSVRASSSLVLN